MDLRESDHWAIQTDALEMSVFRCLRCGDVPVCEIAEHHDRDPRCFANRQLRLKALKGQNPAMPAVMELLKRRGLPTTLLEQINDDNPDWLQTICASTMAWKMKCETIVKAAQDPVYAQVAVHPEYKDALQSLTLLAEAFSKEEANTAWASYFGEHFNIKDFGGKD